MATNTNRVEVVKQSEARLAVTCGWFIDEPTKLAQKWHVIDNHSQIVVHSANTREAARTFAKFYTRLVTA